MRRVVRQPAPPLHDGFARRGAGAGPGSRGRARISTGERRGAEPDQSAAGLRLSSALSAGGGPVQAGAAGIAGVAPRTLGRLRRRQLRSRRREDRMRKFVIAAAAMMVAAGWSAASWAADEPKRGGTLTYLIAADAPPSFDGHREQTFAMIHPVAPFYSLLVRVNPENPSSNDFVCDLCTEMPKPTDDGKTYTFTIRDGVKFHDGSPLTAADVAASWNRIIFPPEGVASARSANYKPFVEKVDNPDPKTVVFRLKFATTAFIPAIADPFNFIYKKKPFDDARVRRALTLAIDRWGGAPALSKIAVVKTVGGIVFPGSPLAATKDELQQMAGFGPDIEKSRVEAKRLLKEAGAENLSFELLNRDVDQPYKYVGICLVDQWSKVGVKVTQKVVATGPWFQAMRSAQYDVVHYPICRSTVNPVLDIGAYLPSSDENYGFYDDPQVTAIHDKLLHESDPQKQHALMVDFQKQVMDTEAHATKVIWWNRIVPYRSYVKGWKISPSHFLNQDLSTVWLDK